jgi:eukaryotic-like serine/threonine-protein kinase
VRTVIVFSFMRQAYNPPQASKRHFLNMSFFCIHCRSEIDPAFKACPFCGELVTDFLRRYLESPIDGKYQILSRLGVGGMGEVYKVLHIHLNSIRVVKLMRAAIADEQGANDRFLREARMATRIQHPNVATLFDFSTLDDGTRYMVWEYIEGTNLHELLEERGPLAPKYAAMLSVQALRGLDAIHRAGIVHRDMSPENLMITRDDEGEEHVKIIDLGIAKQWGDEGDNQTKTGMFVGKWKYCSPEHLGMLEAGERIDGRADLYSFGIVLYEMLTGIPPFQADTPHGYLVLHSSERPRALREVNTTVPESPELEALIFRALEKDRLKRFANAREFAAELEKIVSHLAETPGAQGIPVASEVTDEATRVVAGAKPAVANDAPTVVSVSSSSATVRTNSASAPASRELVGTLVENTPVAPKSKMPVWAVAVAAVLLVLVGTVMVWKNRSDATRSSPPAPVNSAAVPGTPALLAINAFPWANVTAIRNVETGSQIELKQPLVTPSAPIDLPPGRYEVTLANPAFSRPISKTVELRAGDEQIVNVQFSDPAAAPLPRFGAKQ